MNSGDTAARKNGVEPIHIISALLSSTVEVLLIVSLIFIIQAVPADTAEKPPIKMEIIFSDINQKDSVENSVEVSKNDETVSEKALPVFDPVFEALNTFENRDLKTISGENTSGYRLVEKSGENGIEVPESIMSVKSLSISELTGAIGSKKMKRVSSFSSGNSGERINFSSLEQYFPNFTTVQQGLNNDYNALLVKLPKSNLQNIQGTVVANMILKEDGNVDVGIVSAPSPELSNLVLKNLKLLRTGQRIGELTFTVEINFIGSKS